MGYTPDDDVEMQNVAPTGFFQHCAEKNSFVCRKTYVYSSSSRYELWPDRFGSAALLFGSTAEISGLLMVALSLPPQLTVL